MEGELLDRKPAHPGPGTALWIIATLVGIPAGMALMMEMNPKTRWMGYAFPTAMFVTQYIALAIVGRSRPLLLVLGFGLLLAGAFCYREMLPRGVSEWIRFGVYGLFFGVAWAGALAQNGKQAAAWIVLGALSVVAGFWLGEEIFRTARTRVSSRDMARIVSSLGLSLGIVVATVPLIWSFLLSRESAADDGARRRVSKGTLDGGRVALALAGLYLLVLGGATIYGAVKAAGAAPAPNPLDLLRDRSRDAANAYPHDALDLGTLSYVLAGACLVVGVGLLARINAARHAFQVVAPLGALALASVFARKYWTNDLPETLLLGLPFGLLVFALGRRGSISAATLDRDETSAPPSASERGLGWAIGLLAVAFLAYFAIKNNKPLRTRGYGARGYADHMSALNNHVKHLAVTYVLLWHAIPGLLAAAIPYATRKRAAPADAGSSQSQE